MGRSGLSFATLFVLAALVAPPPASAQGRYAEPARWSQPVVAQTDLTVLGHGSLNGETLHLPPGQRIAIEARAVDQNGREFPQERFRFGFDLDSSCNGLVQLESFDHGTINLRTADRTGTCSVLFWVPNNMNLDRTLRIEVGRGPEPSRPPKPEVRPPTGQTPGFAFNRGNEYVASSIFRAALGREPDQRWLANAGDEVRRGQTRDVVRSLLGSAEFRKRQSELSNEQMLESFYRGLLGRNLDPSGRQTYANDIRSRRYEEVILDIVGSAEYRQRMESGGR